MNSLPNEIDAFEYVWNGSAPGWVVHIHHDDAATIWVPVPAEGITPAFFKTVRSLFTEFSDMSTSEFRARLDADGGIETEVLDGLDAEYLHRAGLTPASNSKGVLALTRSIASSTNIRMTHCK